MQYYKDWSILIWTRVEWGFDSMKDLAGWEYIITSSNHSQVQKVILQQMLKAVKKNGFCPNNADTSSFHSVLPPGCWCRWPSEDITGDVFVSKCVFECEWLYLCGVCVSVGVSSSELSAWHNVGAMIDGWVPFFNRNARRVCVCM